MNQKTIVYMMLAFSILIVCSIGYYIVTTMVTELKEHPEITDIGAPPRLDVMAAVVLVTAIVCGIALRLPVKEEDEECDVKDAVKK